MRVINGTLLCGLVGASLLVSGCGDGGDEISAERENACESVDVTTVESISTRADANPEIVEVVPGSSDTAIVISSAANLIAEVKFDETGLAFGQEAELDTGSDTSNMAAVKVDPTGSFAAVMVTEEDCVRGRLLFVDLVDNFGDILGTVEVGFGPDSAAFSEDGRYLVTADEDDREDHPCKPEDRLGGSATVMDLSAGLDAVEVVQTIAVDHHTNSEPEGVAITSDGTVLLAIQETSEIGFFSLDDVPNAEMSILPLPSGSGPDALAITPDGKYAIAGLEFGDGLAVIDIASREIASVYTIRGSGDVPDTYNRDETASDRQHEPEGLVAYAVGEKTFVGVVLQESHALLAYELSDDGELSFDSIAQTGDYQSEESGRESSAVGTEGLTYSEDTGLFITANEREGSLTLLRSNVSDGSCE